MTINYHHNSQTENNYRAGIPDVFALFRVSGTILSFFIRPKTSRESLSSAGDQNLPRLSCFTS